MYRQGGGSQHALDGTRNQWWWATAWSGRHEREAVICVRALQGASNECCANMTSSEFGTKRDGKYQKLTVEGTLRHTSEQKYLMLHTPTRYSIQQSMSVGDCTKRA
eukprot:966288-Pelagomonas_calceolata.AAC.2